MNRQYLDSVTRTYLDSIVSSAHNVRLKLATEEKQLTKEHLDIARNINNKLQFLENEICV